MGTSDISTDLLLGDSNVLANTQPSQAGSSASSRAEDADATTAEDPFTKLHKLMVLNFASIKSDAQTLSGQLGMMQNNLTNLDTTVKTMKSDFDGLNGRLSNVTAQAVANKCGISNINKQLKDMQNKQKEEMETCVADSVAREIGKHRAIVAEIPDEVSIKLDKMHKELDKMKALQTVQQMAASQRPGNHGRRPSSAEEESRQFWNARRKIRCSPIDAGNNGQDLLRNTYQFLEKVLGVPGGELPGDAITDVRRVPGRKRSLTQNEVIITFDTVQTRDCVASYAPNLADWRGKNAVHAGLRLEIPDYLCGVFRVLERHAHQLKEKNKDFFKRSIKYDDVNLTLVLDYCCREGGTWQRVGYEEAAELTRGRLTSARSSTSSYQDEAMGEADNNMPGTSGNNN